MPVVVELPEPEPLNEPENNTPKVPLWKAALKQKKEAKEKKENEEQKKLVSINISIVTTFSGKQYI